MYSILRLRTVYEDADYRRNEQQQKLATLLEREKKAFDVITRPTDS